MRRSWTRTSTDVPLRRRPADRSGSRAGPERVADAELDREPSRRVDAADQCEPEGSTGRGMPRRCSASVRSRSPRSFPIIGKSPCRASCRRRQQRCPPGRLRSRLSGSASGRLGAGHPHGEGGTVMTRARNGSRRCDAPTPDRSDRWAGGSCRNGRQLRPPHRCWRCAGPIARTWRSLTGWKGSRCAPWVRGCLGGVPGSAS
jgi:hypothetical protein